MRIFKIKNKATNQTELEIRTFSVARAIYNALISLDISEAEFNRSYLVA